MSAFELSTLSLSSTLSFAPPVSSSSLLIPNAQSCPSLRCDVDAPHRYEPSPIPPYRYRIPIVYIRRFTPRSNPYPKTNLWEAITGIPDQLDQVVYIDNFGELLLSEVPVEDEDWRILVGRSAIGTAMIVLASRRDKKDSPPPKKLYTHFFSLFECFSI